MLHRTPVPTLLTPVFLHRGLRLCAAALFIACLAAPLGAQQIRINEVMASNGSTAADEDGDFEDWVELHNFGSEPVNLEGWGLSDDYDRPFRWVFPARVIGPDEYLLIWASGKDRTDPSAPLHTNYSISSAGEEVILTHPNGTRVDELPPTVIPGDISLGRLPGQGDAWFFFDQPTPGEANTTPGYDEILPPPQFSRTGGFYTDPFSLSLSAPEGVTILYTLDGTEPDPNELGGSTVSYPYKTRYPNGSLLHRTLETFVYSEPIAIDDRSGHANPITGITQLFSTNPHSPPGAVFSGTPVRAVAVREGALPSRAETHTFFIHPEGESRYDDILVLSIVTDERNLFDYHSGIYVPGVYADDWYAQTNSFNSGWIPANYQGRGMDWERPAHLEIFGDNGARELAQGVGLRSHGGWSRYFSWRRSLRLYARGAYDEQSSFDYPLLPGLTQRGGAGAPVESFERVILRNSGNDWNGTLFQDAVQQSLLSELPIDSQAYSRAIVYFINGTFWGLKNIRERLDQHYVASHYDMDPDDVVILDVLPEVDPAYVTMTDGPYYAGLPKPNLMVKRGTLDDRDDYLAMYNYAIENDLSDPAHFAHMETLMDMENFATYWAVHVFAGNHDWPQNNRDFWRKRTDGYVPDAPYGHDGRWRWMVLDLDFGFEGDAGRNSLARTVENRSVEPFGGFGTWTWPTNLFQNLLDNEGFRNLFISKLAQMATVFHPDRVDEAVDAFNARIANYRSEHWARWGSGTNTGGFIRNFAQQRAAHVVNHVLEVFDLPGASQVSVSDPGQPGGWLEINGMRVDGSTPGTDPEALFEVPLFGEGSEWRYLDDGSDQGTAWRMSGFSDSGWNEGPGAFGYGDHGGFVTEIDYGGNAGNKPITTYFRNRFDWTEDALPEFLDLEMTLAGGAVVYLNGEEVVRHRMPDGEIDHNTLAGGLNSPALVSGLAAWYAADGGMETRTDAVGNTRLTEWTDLAGNGRHAVQGTDTWQPMLVENELNGRPVVRFSGAGVGRGNGDNFMQAPLDDYRDGMTLFLVARVRAPGDIYDSYLGTNGAGAGNVLYHVGSGGGQGLGITQPNLDLANNNTFSDEWELIRIDATGNHVHTMTRVMSGEAVRVQLANTSGTVDNLTLGASKDHHDIVMDFLPVDIAEVVVYGRELSAGERSSVEAFLSEKYGFTGSPPASDDLRAWYAADGDMNTRSDFGGNTRVTSWTDLSGNGSHAVQGTNSAQPLLVANELSGRPVVRFSGGGGSFGNQNNFLEAPIGDYRDGMTLFLVARVRENGGSFDSYLGTNGAGLGNVLYHVGSGGGRGLGITQPNVNLGNNNTFSSEWELIRIDADSTYTHTMTRVLSGDSVSVQLGTTGGTVNNLTLGASKHSGEGITDHLPVDIAEVLLYGRELNPGEILGAQRYLAVKYGFDLPEVGTFFYQVDAGAMTQGDNVLAVEVHLETPFQDLFHFDMAAGANAVAASPMWSGTYFQGVPVEVRAVPRGGYRFVGWAGRDETDESLTLTLDGDVTFTPLFEVDETELGDTVPAPHILSSGPYYFNEWPADAPAATYPSNMIFEQTSTEDPALTVPMDSYWVLPYDFDSRSRVNGLGTDGFAFINTANAQDHPEAGFLGSALLALDTRGEEGISVTWRAGTVLPNSRVYNLRLQYRIGDSGPFLDVLDEVGMPVEYLRNPTPGHTEVIGPVLLPAETEDRPLVQLRWKYYYTGVRLDPESGQRSQLRIDEILVSSGELSGDVALTFDDLHPAGQANKPLIPFKVTARDEGGTPDLTFGGDITVSLEEGPGDLSGTLTRTASGGEVVFDDLMVDAPGQYRLRVQSDDADPAVSTPITVAAVTEVLMPRVIQGVEPENNDRVPFAYRVRIDGLQPNATYRYGNRVEEEGEAPDQDGAGNMLLVFTDGGPFVRNTDAPDFAPDQLGVRHAEFTADSSGSYEGWFVTEPTGNRRFVPGDDLRMRILLNDGAGGEDYYFYLSTHSPVRVTSFGDQPEQGSALYGESLAGPRSFLFLYDDTDGASRPVTGTVVESTGAQVDERYATFYLGQVAGRDGFWGSLIPNDLEDGILRLEERSLMDGSLLDAFVLDEPLSGTVMASHGPTPVFADLREGPVFLPQGDGLWNVGANWSGGVVPNGAGEPAIIHLTADNNREVSLGQNITIGQLFLDNDTASRNRLVGAGGGLTFQGAGGNQPIVRVGGFGTGFHEFNISEGITLNDSLRIAVDNVSSDGEYGALRIREDLTGSGGLIKEGAGVLSLTGGGKTYTGATVVDGGVLRVTESSVPTATSGVSVTSMGQLRLVSHGPGRVYTFGGDLTLDSLGPDEGPVVLPQAGRLGALRLDPELETRDSNEDVHEGTVTNNIHFAGDSHVHVDGTSNLLTLSGSLSGSGTLLKSGGGTVVLTGTNDLYAGGTTIMTGTLFVQEASALGGGPLQMVASGGSEPELVLNNAVQTVASLEGELDDLSAITITLANGTVLDVAQAVDTRFQGALTGGGSLLKRGEGVLRLTRGPNPLLGTVSVQQGVLEVTESSQPSQTAQLSVSPGGQLRLTSTGERTYTFGSGSLSIEGAGIDPEAPASKGALRQEGSDATDVATITNAITLEGGLAGIHVNRDEGAGSTMILGGNLSGPADLFKTGGGTLILEGANTEWSGGTLVENGLLVVEPGSRLGPGALFFTDPERERRVELRQAEQTVGGLSGDVEESEGGTLELLLAAGHLLTVNQESAGLFAGNILGAGSFVKTGPATLRLTGVSALDGEVLVEEGALRIDGEMTEASELVAGESGSIEGTGFVGALGGSGRVAPGGGSAGILDASTFDPQAGLGAAFVFGGTGSPDYENRTDSGNALLRLSGTSGFAGDLGAGNTVSIFLDVADLQAGDEFRGGFFVESASDFAGRIGGADFRFFLRDAAGQENFRGTAYRPYSGPLSASVDTVEENGGRVMRVTWETGTTLTYAEWAASHFDDPEDQSVAGPEADPDEDGVKNLLEYALGMDPLQASRAGLPEVEYTEEGAAIVFHRDPNLSDIAYVVEASNDLEMWDEILYDSRENTQPNNQGDFMRIEDPSGEFRRFLRLRVILLE